MHETAVRLYHAMQHLKNLEGQSNVARFLNESPQTMRNWETRGVSKSGAVKVQAAIGCDANWLLSGTGEMVKKPPPAPAPLFASEPWTEFQPVKPGSIRGVPIVGRTAGGNLPERVWDDGDFPVGHTDSFAEVASSDPHAFVTQVIGLSMIPKFMPKEYALIEPGTEPELEDDVLVRLTNGQTLLKKLLSRRGVVRLGSYNDPEILTFEPEEITWMYYVAYPVPARKIKHRL